MTDSSHESDGRFNRRTYLRLTGAAATVPAMSATVAGDADYDRVVDVVEAGADPTGSEPIDDVLEEHNRDGTLLEFPDGDYLINQFIIYGRTNFGMRGTGDATLIPGPDYDPEVWIGGGGLEHVTIENLTVDNTAPDTYPQLAFSGPDDIVVRDVTKVGEHDGDVTAFGIGVYDEHGSALVENLQMADGSEPQTAVGCYVNSNGPVTLRDCHIEGFGNNGLYASTADAPVRVEGGTYKNNDIAQVRLGSPDSYVRNATIGVDEDDPDHDNCRGVRISDGPGPVTIEGCHISMEDGKGGGAIVGAYSGGSFAVRNSRIYVGPDYTTASSGGTRGADAILVDEPTGIENPGTRTIESVSITGGGDYRSAICLRRNNNDIRGVCIHQTGTQRNGVVVQDYATNNTVDNCRINVTGDPVKVNDGDLDVSGLSTTGECVYPDGVDGTTSQSTDVSLSEAPWPDAASRLTYAIMGGDNGASTAELYLNFADDGASQAALQALPTLLGNYVAVEELNIRFRAYGLTDDRDRYLAGMALGVWDLEWPKYWDFFQYLFENKDDYTLQTYGDGKQFLADAGIRNYATIAAYAIEGKYDDALDATASYGGYYDVPTSTPQLSLNWDTTRMDRGSDEELADLVDWVGARL